MEINLKIAGVILIVLALAHMIFPRYFNWAEELKQLSLVNRQMMYVHAFFIGVMVLLMGIWSTFYTHQLVTTDLGRKIGAGLGVFWLLRLIVQFFVYSKELWRGKKLETKVHIFFSLLWIYLIYTFFAIAFK